MRKFLISTAIATTFALPSLAATVAEGDELAETQEYNFWLLDAIKTTDPQKNTDVEGSQVLRQLFEGLMNEDEKGAMVPGVATDYTVSEDGLTYTFNLRPEAKWSNGEPVTAGDFVYGWQRAVDPANASQYAWFMELMNIVNASEIVAGDMAPDQLGVTAVDDNTLEVKLTKPTPYFVKMTSHTTTFPVLKSVVDEFGDDWTQPGNLVGNGAFVLTDHNLGVTITMEKNPEYWDADNVILTKMTGITVNDQNVALTRYQAGELDRMDIPAGQYPRLKEEFPDEAVSMPYSCSYAYLVNMSDKGREELQDPNIRRALALGLNRDIIVEQVLQGGQRPSYNWTHWATEGFEMPEIEMAGMTQEDRTAEAKRLLEEAGYTPDNPLNLTLNYNTSEDHKKIAVVAQQMWKPLGVNLTLNNMEWKVHTDRMQNQDFELARYAWCADYNEASTYLDYFRSTGSNYGEFNNAEYDALLDEAVTSDNPNEQYTAAEQILAAELPLIPIYHYANVDMIKPYVKGLALENVMDNWYGKDMYITAH
ncbi:peptide ABC transporter substrate-binding protein [Paracoccus aerodenitrificans]|uniref:peptide ABC transporter substrate-binding protein n=1 Tax=Paracoccus aerodenitrificans TaxID=3017781 RepID=UPI0022F11435|nr:peptide ABC transporter substrate-binding protein [Paracoccus aerodenitrificans]WBU65182.1 peptide ABC transporter substrate-binding protein [Paracoccus aerodenitrificans]